MREFIDNVDDGEGDGIPAIAIHRAMQEETGSLFFVQVEATRSRNTRWSRSIYADIVTFHKRIVQNVGKGAT